MGWVSGEEFNPHITQATVAPPHLRVCHHDTHIGDGFRVGHRFCSTAVSPVWPGRTLGLDSAIADIPPGCPQGGSRHVTLRCTAHDLISYLIHFLEGRPKEAEDVPLTPGPGRSVCVEGGSRISPASRPPGLIPGSPAHTLTPGAWVALSGDGGREPLVIVGSSGGTSLGEGLCLPVVSLLSPAPGPTGCLYPEPCLCQEMGTSVSSWQAQEREATLSGPPG